MKDVWKYILLFVGVLLLAFCAALPLFGIGFMRFGGFGMRRFGIPSGGLPMMGGRGIVPGILGLLLLLVMLAVLALVIAGIVWLVRRNRTTLASMPAAATTHACPNCGRQVQNDWSNCPYCGQRLNVSPPPPPPPAAPTQENPPV